MLKQELIDAHGRAVHSIKNHFQILPMDKLAYTPHPKAFTMEQLIRHLQASELHLIRGTFLGDWKMDGIPTDVTSRDAMIATLEANHKESLKLLEPVSESDLLTKTVKAPFMEGTIMKMLMTSLDHLHHHRTQLFLYLKLLNLDVNTMTIWGPGLPQ